MKVATDSTDKLANKGVQSMFVRYTVNHAEDVFGMYDPLTNSVYVTRDIIWLKWMFQETKHTPEVLGIGVPTLNTNLPKTL